MNYGVRVIIGLGVTNSIYLRSLRRTEISSTPFVFFGLLIFLFIFVFFKISSQQQFSTIIAHLQQWAVWIQKSLSQKLKQTKLTFFFFLNKEETPICLQIIAYTFRPLLGQYKRALCNYKQREMQRCFRLLIFLNQPYMFRATNSPILRSTFWLHIQLLAAVSVHCAKSCMYSQKVLLSMGEFVARNMGWFKKKNKGKICIFLVTYIVVLVMHGHTNIKERCIDIKYCQHQQITDAYTNVKIDQRGQKHVGD